MADELEYQITTEKGFWSYLGEGISWVLWALAIIILFQGCQPNGFVKILEALK